MALSKTRISRKKLIEYEFQPRTNRSFILLKDVVKVRKETRKYMQNWTLTLLCIYLSMHLALFEVLITRAIANEAGLGIAARYHIGCICQVSSHKFIDKISDTRLFFIDFTSYWNNEITNYFELTCNGYLIFIKLSKETILISTKYLLRTSTNVSCFLTPDNI